MKHLFSCALILISSSVCLAATPEKCIAYWANLQKHLEIELRTPQDLANTYYLFEPVAPKVMKVERGARARDVEEIKYGKKLSDRLDIEKVMKGFNLNRLQAVEVQALLRRFAKSPNDSQFMAAVDSVRKGQTLSRLNIEKVKAAPFTLVLDVDGTLLDQDTKDFVDEVHEASFLVDGEKVHHVALNPGAVKLIAKARSMGAAVVLFSRNNDSLIWEIIEEVKVGKNTLASIVDGVLTSSHMLMPEEYRDRTSYDMGKDLRKDLSIIPAQRLVLVDDDASYVLQEELVIEVSKFEVDDILDRRSSYNGYSDYGFGKKDKDESYDEFKDDESSEDGKLSKKEKKNLKDLKKNMVEEYAVVAQQLDILASDLNLFTTRQIVFSPVGREAIDLLTEKHKRYQLENHSKLSEREAIDYLMADPSRVKVVIQKKKRKESKFESNSWPSSFGGR